MKTKQKKSPEEIKKEDEAAENEVIYTALDFLEQSGDDAFTDIKNNPKMRSAFLRLAKRCGYDRTRVGEFN